MSLPEDIINTFNDPSSVKVLAAIDEKDNLYLTPMGSLSCTDDESKLFFAKLCAINTSKRLKEMKSKGLKTIALAAISNIKEKVFKGYSIKCDIADQLTSGPFFDKVSRNIERVLGLKTKSVWTLVPLEYKIHTPGPEMGKVIKV